MDQMSQKAVSNIGSFWFFECKHPPTIIQQPGNLLVANRP